MRFSTFFFHTTQRRAENGQFWPASGRGWWHGLGPASDTPLSWSPYHTRRPGAYTTAARLAWPASGIGERPDPRGGEEAHRLVGDGCGKRAARRRRSRRAGNVSAAEKAVRRSGVEASNFLKSSGTLDYSDHHLSESEVQNRTEDTAHANQFDGSASCLPCQIKSTKPNKSNNTIEHSMHD